MLAKIWSWIKKLFTKEFVGTILSKLIENAKTKITEEILNAENQEAAFNFVKELNADTTLSTEEKAKKFNEQLLAWAKSLGKTLSSSTINCLRELAVAAFKAEAETIFTTSQKKEEEK